MSAKVFLDSNILVYAQDSGSGILCTEDLNPGQIIMGVKIQSPLV